MDEIEVELTGLVYGGDAMGRLPDGRALFVPYALPGERVRVSLIEEKRGHARARLIEILRPSPERIAPRCAHFGQCGGCHYQMLPYPRQVEIKTAIFREQLERIAGIKDPPVLPPVPAPDPWHYRNAVQFHLTPTGSLGYQRGGSHEVIPIRECFLPQGALNDLWPQLALDADAGIDRVELRLGAEEELLVALTSETAELPELEVDLPVSVVHLSQSGAVVLAGDGDLRMEILGRPFRVSAGSFFQVNTAQAEALVQHVLDLLPLPPGSTVLDLYCGAGLFSAFLAQRSLHVVGIELSEPACADFAVNLDEFDGIELYQGAAEQILPELHLQVDAALVDPPRSGMERAALQALIHMAPPLLVYVSCDPATLARDARLLLQSGYRLVQATPFDLFPQTYAIESVSLFTRTE